MTVRELITALVEHPLSSLVYISKGVGPPGTVRSEVTDRIYVVLDPVRPIKPERRPDGEICDCDAWPVGHIHTPKGLQPIDDDLTDGDDDV